MAFSQDRIAVVTNPNCIYENVLDSIVKSINEENLEEYSKHFASFTKKDRLNTSMFFLRHEPTVIVFEKHVLEKTESKVELAIAYQISCDVDQKNYKFSSIITMKKIGDSWKFSKEKVVSFSFSNKNCSSCYNKQEEDLKEGILCIGGQCNVR